MNRYTREVREFWKNHKALFVQVDENKLAALAKKLLENVPGPPDWRIPGILPDSPSAFISQTFYICAIDFAFTHFEPPHAKFRLADGISGSMAATACFYRRFGENPVSVEEMLKISSSLEKTKEFFQGVNLPPLIENRRENLHEAAKIVKILFSGDPLNILKENDYTVTKMIDTLITTFPISFGSDYYKVEEKQPKPRMLFLNKRAQLWPLIYQGRALSSNNQLQKLKDEKSIGPVADYQIPKYLKSVRVLRYKQSLEEKIAAQELIPYGSPEEIEIRCATVYAVAELIKKTGVAMTVLDYFLWTEGQKVKELKHHLTKTTAY